MGWRRRYCPSPTCVFMVVAVCVFYQCLSLLWTRTPWTIEVYGSGADSALMDVSATSKTKDCLSAWTSLYMRMKEFEGSMQEKQNPRVKKRAFLYAPSLLTEDYSMYRDILAKLGYTMLSEDVQNLTLRNQELLTKGMLTYKDVLIYIPSNNNIHLNCKEMWELAQSRQTTKVLPEILCSKEMICKMADICPELQNLLICSTNSGKLSSRRSSSSKVKNEYKKMCRTSQLVKDHFNLQTEHEHPSQKSPLMRIYVLTASMSPLRAFIHSIGIVQSQPNEPYIPVKLQSFYGKLLKSYSASKAFSALKETIAKFLLTLEVLSEASDLETNLIKRCQECFQLLTVEVGLNDMLQPTVLQVKSNFQFDGLNKDNQKYKELIIGNAFSFILRNTSFSFLKAFENIQEPVFVDKGVCWMDDGRNLTLEQLNMLFSFAQELTNPGEFEMIYPSTYSSLVALKKELYNTVDPIGKLEPISSMHALLSDLHLHFNLLKNITQFSSPSKTTFGEKWRDSSASFGGVNVPSGHPKQKNCSKDDDTLSHIRRIFTIPQLDLTPEFNPHIKAYHVEVPFDVVTVEIGVEPVNCKAQVHLEEKNGPSIANFPLGLGFNQITIYVTEDSKADLVILGTYRITVHREDRPSMPLFGHYNICGFVQDCGLVIDPEQPCGLQPLSSESLSRLSQAQQRKCDSGDARGQWVVPCMSCTDNRTCDWHAVSWQTYNCQHTILSKLELQQCLKDRKVLFIGDSTNRGIMYYLIERVNETLQEWQKSHSMTFYNNVNQGRTAVSYSYYPQFWINDTHRPSFEHALEQLIKRSRPLKNTNQTILVVGGVQWLSTNHLLIIQRVLKRENLSNILVIVKSTGMGFHLPVHRIRSLTPIQIKQLHDENLLILKTAKLHGYEVVDTFSITMGRYKEFLQGKCGCHFHEVVKSNVFQEHYTRKMRLFRKYTLGGMPFPQLQELSPNFETPYHVMGPVNQAYSEILLSRMCV
ncbi:cadherin-like and PC-esterase domain-containing protein 1 [Spea bombifrons]|uniref:cadherin-like and PC-esterase domain-containing protein 1 n=1 Tax=Spea bombifrons TaxID=233779 RepID=UPI00234B289C|nr:cadherin-like and PC-esterase domain-containing protein 1 [Spea bombifrons]